MDSAVVAGTPRTSVCPLCGGPDGDVIGASANGMLIRCADCTLSYHCELLGASAQEAVPYYGDDRAYEDYRRCKEPKWEDLFTRLRRYLPFDRAQGGRGGRLLDVGCARGYSTAVARRLGFDAYGVEMSAADAAYARERLGLPVRTGTVETAGFQAGFFDAVVAWSVLEHLSAPVAAVAAISRLLRLGGVLNIFTPNGKSRTAREQGLRWIEYNRPGHVAFFCPMTLQRLLTEQGLQVVELYTTLLGGGPEAQGERGALLRWAMGPSLAPVRRRLRPLLALMAGTAAREGEYMGVYARKTG